jgi:prephenate dehydrogenase
MQSLKEFERAINNHDAQTLAQLLTTARHWRDQVPTGLKGILPNLYELTVTVPDRPGVIGEISNLLGYNRINISDIEIQRVREEDEGTIRLGFSQEYWCEQAYELLTREGFLVKKRGCST